MHIKYEVIPTFLCYFVYSLRMENEITMPIELLIAFLTQCYISVNLSVALAAVLA